MASATDGAKRTCGACGAQRQPSEPAFPWCSGCRKVAYCNKDCQSTAWPTHRSRCFGANLLRQYYSNNGLTLTFTLDQVGRKAPPSVAGIVHAVGPPADSRLQLLTHVLAPDEGRAFWQTYLTSFAEARGFERDKTFTIQLRPPQPGGGDWAGALGSWTPHRTVAWNEQAAIVITVPSFLSFPFCFSFPFPPKKTNPKITD